MLLRGFSAWPAYHQVHELVESLETMSASARPQGGRPPYPNGSHDADRELLVEPDLYCRPLLEELEKKVDGGQEHAAAAATSSSSHGSR